MSQKIQTNENEHKIARNFLQEMKGGRQHLTWPGLLDRAFNRTDGPKLRSIRTELIQIPSEANQNLAIVMAYVEMEDGSLFTDVGDASPANVGKMVAPHIIRMASTRAKARALRDACNIGEVLTEEMGDSLPVPRPSSAVTNFIVAWKDAERRPKLKDYIIQHYGSISSVSPQELAKVPEGVLIAAIQE